MVYCKYVSNTDCTVTYQYGARVDDITGLLVFRFSEGEEGFEIIKEPEKTRKFPMRLAENSRKKARIRAVFLARIRAFCRREDGIVYVGHRGDRVCCESCGVGIVLQYRAFFVLHSCCMCSQFWGNAHIMV